MNALVRKLQVAPSQTREPAVTAEPFEVPDLAAVSSTYAALVKKNEDLGRDRHELDKQLKDVERQLQKATPSLEATGRIAALLADVMPATPVAEGLTSLRQRYAEIRQKISDIDRAVAVLAERIRDERGRASIAICERVRPEYKRRVAAVCTALIEAQMAALSLQELVDDLEANDVAWLSLQPMAPINILGPVRDPQSRVGMYLADAASHGFIDRAELPTPFRKGA